MVFLDVALLLFLVNFLNNNLITCGKNVASWECFISELFVCE